MKLIITLSFFAFAFYGNAQQPIIPRFDILGVNEGLSQSSVYAIYQDKIGYMWFGTADGLNRYDGKEVKVYKPVIKNPQNGFSNFIRGNICEDNKRNLWYINETGIFCYNRLKDSVEVIQYLKDNSFLEEKLVFIDSLQTLWSFNINKGVSAYNIISGQTHLYPFPFKVNYNLIRGDIAYRTMNAIVFALYFNDGYYIFDTDTKQYKHFTEDKSIPNIFSFKDEFALVINDSMVVKTTKNVTVKKIPLPASVAKDERKFIYNILPDNYGRIWISIPSNGLFYYSEKEKKYYQYKHDNSKLQSLSIDLVRTLFIDRNDNLWIGTDGGGVCKLDLKPAKFNLFPLNEGDYHFLNNYFTKCFYEDDKGKVYVGTLNGLNVFNPQDYSVKNYTYNASDKYSVPGNYVSAIFKDSKNRIWVAGSLGVALFSEATGKFNRIKLPEKLEKLLLTTNYFIYRLIETTDGSIVAATMYGIVFFNADKQQNIMYADTGYLNMGPITDIKEISPNEFWFTSPTNGLYHFQKKQNKYIYKEQFFPNIDLRCIAPDEEDKQVIWIGSGVGLIRFDTRTKQYILYDNKDGLNNSYIYGVLEDKQHNLWLSTNGGIFMFNKQTHQFIHYDADYGLQSNEFNTGAYYKSNSGNFYFGGIKGFNWFKPEHIARTTLQPVAAISEISINEVVHNNDTLLFHQKKLTLSYDENDLVFKVASLDFTKPDANRFQYQLQDWDDNFIITDNNVIRYSKLPPGNYVFVLKTSNSDDVWSNEEKIYITITPPFWQTWWFYMLMIIVIIVVAIVSIRTFVKKKLKEQQRELEKQKALVEERQRISREMHDDIGSGLTQIALMSDAAIRKNKSTELNDIAQTSRKLISSMSEIVWSLQTENKPLEQLFAYIREQLFKLLEYTDIDYQIQFPDNTNHIILKNKQSRNILLITKELVNNAVKHSKAKHISISCNIKNQQLYFEVKDDGIGFTEFASFEGNGLKNIKSRIDDIKGILTINSTKGYGTTFNYTIPL
ncbi:MAG: hypothetical protein JSR09_04865 [Bacteroidetes bacterium]|nr:hypothetical protein [Bacteroidota bacterium]MBS1649018.1 hypothetical protein [Bacteroidota bacterium]